MQAVTYVAVHKPGLFATSPGYQPIHVGRALATQDLGLPGDDTGDHISALNPNFCELTLLYWMWKNATADVVGLDTMAHVIKTMADTLPDDPWHRYFDAPAWLKALIEKGALGQKTGAGIFRKQGKDILVLDLKAQDYRPADRKAADEIVEILRLFFVHHVPAPSARVSVRRRASRASSDAMRRVRCRDNTASRSMSR